MGDWNTSKWVDDQDRSRSRTSFDLDNLRHALQPIRAGSCARLLDVGCGYGGLTGLVGDYLDAPEVHGVDVDDRVLGEARSKGVTAVQCDIETDTLPYPDEHFDLVMTFGMMDYLPAFDGMLREVNRVLAPGGHALVALPNLGSWYNRAALLLGYQPRDIEISNETAVGVLKYHDNRAARPVGHIHTATVRAFTQLMHHHGFNTVAVSPGRARVFPLKWPLELVDRTLCRRPSLARRFYYLGAKQQTVVQPEKTVNRPYQSLS